jgi:hypothetical protein
MKLTNKGMEMSDNIHTVKLRNGTEISWEHFSGWSLIKQRANLEKLTGNFSGSELEISRSIERRKKANSEGRNWALPGGMQSHARKVRTPKGVCQTITEAARLYLIDGGTMRSWINGGKLGFSFLTPAKASTLSKSKKGGVAGDANPRSRAVLTPKGRFPTLTGAAKAFGVSKDVMSVWVRKSKTDQFKFEHEGNNHAMQKKVIITPAGSFGSIREAGNYFGISAEAMRCRLKSKTWIDFRYESLKISAGDDHK